ncbi:MAG: flotillin family protein, partial [Hyphomicrobiales bacterium]|nr:flotillin family protein [Hyphomicrobiales bacterium]
ETTVENARMDSAIEIARKSREQSVAQADAEAARAQAVEAEERVKTVRESEVARRRRQVELVIAEKEAEEVRIAAAAEQVRATVEAESQRAFNEAENVLSDSARASIFRRRLLERIEGIVRESVKPMEKIEGIRILQVDGLNGGGRDGGGGRSATDEVIDSALRYRVQAPMIDQILAEIGIEGGSLARMPGLIREARDMQGIRKETAKKPPGEGGGGGGGDSTG